MWYVTHLLHCLLHDLILSYSSLSQRNSHIHPILLLTALGPRILTFFIYLTDVELGGETYFPSLGIDVKPKKGRALLWTNVQDGNPVSCDSGSDYWWWMLSSVTVDLHCWVLVTCLNYSISFSPSFPNALIASFTAI